MVEKGLYPPSLDSQPTLIQLERQHRIRPSSRRRLAPKPNHARPPLPHRRRLLPRSRFSSAVGPRPLRTPTIRRRGVVQLGHRDRGRLAKVLEEVHPIPGRPRPYGSLDWCHPHRIFLPAFEKVAQDRLEV